MDHTVAIPTKFFLDEAKNEYYDYRTRLVQELLQNSLDAGATLIRLTFGEEGYACLDNGRGMTRDRMVEALLTMGGSVKEVGATGGFGAAKKLLLFAHKSFSIVSNDTFVQGEGLSYRFIDRSYPINGTEVSAKYSDPTDFTSMTYIACNLLEKCNFRNRVRVIVNGIPFTDYATARHSRTILGLGELYANKTKAFGENRVNVLHNGLYMFSRYVSDLNRKVILEVSGKSIDLFTQNRDGFRGEYARAFDDLIGELSIDKESVAKERQRNFILTGVKSFIDFIGAGKVSPELDAKLCGISFRKPSVALSSVLTLANDPTTTEADKAVLIQLADTIRDVVETSFHFNLADTKYRKVPEKFIPNVGKPKYTELAKLWKAAVKEVLRANGISQQFRIGFTFDSTAIATHQTMQDGAHCYMINPLAKEVDRGTKQEKVTSIYMTALHEVVHSQGFQYHDERFVLQFHKLLGKVLTKGKSWRQLMKAAKLETI